LEELGASQIIKDDDLESQSRRYNFHGATLREIYEEIMPEGEWLIH
jgi:hypothetical protein